MTVIFFLPEAKEFLEFIPKFPTFFQSLMTSLTGYIKLLANNHTRIDDGS